MRFAWVAALLVLVACSEGRPPPPPSGPDAGTPTVCRPGGLAIECAGSTAHLCDRRGDEVRVEDCGATGGACLPDRGCVACVPSSVRCDGETTLLCNPEGTGFTPGPTCDAAAGQRCSPIGCADLCALAREQRSYIGCEYWPVTTLNSQLEPEFTFAVVVANPQLVPAEVVIDRGGTEIERRTIEPGALATIPLPWVDALRGGFERERSILVRDGAYRLRADVPVTVYQFNPLEFQLDHDCATEPARSIGDNRCFSFTNDASLLLPSHVLTGSYLGLSRPAMALHIERADGTFDGGSPGFLVVVAVEDGTDVEVRSRARTTGSDDGTVAPLLPGGSATFRLDAGDVLSLATEVPTPCPGERLVESLGGETVEYCTLGAEHDLTGSEIRASRPVAVVGGHNCAFVPFHRWACDHLEEQLFPVESWGRDVLVSTTEPVRREPNLLRIVSGHDGNAIRFEPEVAPPVVLDRGGVLDLEVTEHVRVVGSMPLAVVQLLVGQDYFGRGSSGAGGIGDPSMSLAIPTEQQRTEYTFLTPATYRQSFVNVTAPDGSRILLDGRLLGGFVPVGSTGHGAARVELDPGVHRIEGNAPFGIVVYGFAPYTSYMVPGGLDLRPISPPI